MDFRERLEIKEMEKKEARGVWQMEIKVKDKERKQGRMEKLVGGFMTVSMPQFGKGAVSL